MYCFGGRIKSPQEHADAAAEAGAKLVELVLSFWLRGMESKEQTPRPSWQCRDHAGTETGPHSPSPGCDKQERDVASSRATTPAELENMQGLFLSVLPPEASVLSLHCSSSKPAPTPRLSKHWRTVRQLARSVPFSLCSCSRCQFCLHVTFLAC